MLLPGVSQSENTTLQLFQGVGLFLGGSTYLLINKYGESSCLTVHNYWGVPIFLRNT